MIKDDLHPLVGCRLDDFHGGRIGRVESVLLDPETGLAWLLVSLGQVTRRLTLVPAGDVVHGAGRASLSLPRAQVRSAPRLVDERDATTPQFRSMAYRHYGITAPRRRGRLAAAAAR